MARITLDWDEATNRRLPMVCATCGNNATEFVERRLSAVRLGFLVRIRTKATVYLPYCDEHVHASWNGFLRVIAWSIRQESITLGQVSPDFVDAVLDQRDRPTRPRRRTSGNKDNEALEVLPADEPPRRPRSGGSGRLVYGVLMPILVLLVVSCCGFGLLFLNLFRTSSPANNRPGINRHAPPDFGPRGPLRKG